MSDFAITQKEEPTRKPLSSFVVDHESTLGMTGDQIDSLRPPYVIDGFARRGEVMLLGAESKSRKSWLAQDAGFAVASGIPWLSDEDGTNGFPVAKARVHVLDLELNPEEMRFRFAKARGNRFSKSPQKQAEVTSGITAYSFDGMNVVDILVRLDEVKPSVQPGDLVVLDCLYRLAPDGNETVEVAAILETVKRFASETQAALILVDHFRKAGADKARDRFAGTFVKQASASTLVAVEVKEDVLHINIDARTFHGCPLVHARFDLESYTFQRVLESELENVKEGRKQAEEESWLLVLWKSRSLTSTITAGDAVEKFAPLSLSGTKKRLGKLVERQWMRENPVPKGKAVTWSLAADGEEMVRGATGIKS